MSRSSEKLVVHELSFHPSFFKATLLDDVLSEHEEGDLVRRSRTRKHKDQVTSLSSPPNRVFLALAPVASLGHRSLFYLQCLTTCPAHNRRFIIIFDLKK